MSLNLRNLALSVSPPRNDGQRRFRPTRLSARDAHVLHMTLQVKVHDVMHENKDYQTGEAEDYIERMLNPSVNVTGVRIASGPRNSPVFVTVDTRSLTLDAAKSIARSAIIHFQEYVEGIDIERTIRDGNIRIRSA